MLFSQSDSSIPSNHEQVILKKFKFELDTQEFSRRPFSMVQDGVKCSSLSSENAYSNLIWACLVDAIHLGSLEGNLKLMTEASLSSTLQADLLVL